MQSLGLEVDVEPVLEAGLWIERECKVKTITAMKPQNEQPHPLNPAQEPPE